MHSLREVEPVSISCNVTQRKQSLNCLALGEVNVGSCCCNHCKEMKANAPCRVCMLYLALLVSQYEFLPETLQETLAVKTPLHCTACAKMGVDDFCGPAKIFVNKIQVPLLQKQRKNPFCVGSEVTFLNVSRWIWFK